MTNEDYRKCKTCRFCRHSDDDWKCTMTDSSTEPRSSCERYRPGCCENCNRYSDGVCSLTEETMYELDVCTEYDPHGSRR